ncbi:hypothetical protein ElyMa_002353300 [Elysia marginata]|uniref:Uncharacterized protein n=1 Tax=Elysia marginata TaxID=1093978 RepID=A0AAV4GBG9_9GAST|nr:hypothetical protein ElyMa_002353300 [Elysia marginata]
MPVTSVIRRQTNLRSSQVGAFLLQKLYFNHLGNGLLTPAIAFKAPLSSRHGLAVLRHISFTPSFQIFAKLTSLISKLAVEPDVPQRPLEHKVASKVEPKLEELHQEITGSSTQFLEEYDKNLNDLVEQIKPPTKEIPKTSINSATKRTYSKRELTQKTKERIRFFRIYKPSRSTVTTHFNDTYKYLQSLGILCDELHYFPDIQRMSQEEIVMCIERLKTYGIHRVFSLFLIQRTLAELKIGNPAKMRDGRTSVPHLAQVRHYLLLCELLQRPDLDIVPLLDMLSKANGYESMATLVTKVKKLLSVGATADIIWKNIDLLITNSEILDRKIKLYKRSRFSPNTPFPVTLFLKSVVSFQEGLDLGDEVRGIAELLDVSTEDFQACWGFYKFRLAELAQKVRMCIKVGIPKTDVFDNLSILNNFPLQKCYEVTTQFQKSGMPASIFILREMDEANSVNGGSLPRASSLSGPDDSQWEQVLAKDGTESQGLKASNTQEISTQSACSYQESEKKLKESVHLVFDGEKEVSSSVCGFTASSTTRKLTSSTNVRKTPRNNQVESSKRSRRVLFNLVARLLSLEPQTVSEMFQCGLSIISVNRLDITRNLDFLLRTAASGGGGFTLPQVAQCPLILVHPHAQLKAAVWTAPKMVDSYLLSSPAFASASPPPFPTQSQWEDFDERDEKEDRGEISKSSPHAGNVDEKKTSQSLSSPAAAEVKQSTAPFHVSFSTLSSTFSASPAGQKLGDIELSSSVESYPASDTADPECLKKLLFSCPVRHLNLVQYFLERDSSFSLGNMGSHEHYGFLNRPL